MREDPKQRARVLELVREKGGLAVGVATEVARATGVPEADVYGAASFFHLLNDPNVKVRVCTGLTCQLHGADKLLRAAKDAGLPAAGCSCLAACDRAPALLRDRDVLVEVTNDDLVRATGDWKQLRSTASDNDDWLGRVGPDGADSNALAMNLHGAKDFGGSAVERARKMGPEALLDTLDESGLQGRGGAGFPAGRKWRGVRAQRNTPHYVVLNADEGEPATFKDRELLTRRPDLVLEGLAIAAHVVGAEDIFLYLRGEFGAPWRSLEDAIEQFARNDVFADFNFHLHAGHGAYICGEETALLEALEGKRGMPRLKPPFPHEVGLWGKPTLVQNVETIACVPGIVTNGGQWFKELGKTGAGTKLYSLSGHVAQPGNYEMPLGVCLDELVEAAGGYLGTPKAFSPGGASLGFLPMSERKRPLDFKALGEVGSMLGSAGVVVLNDTVDMAWAAKQQLVFFEAESCGQCAPCRIGTRFVREAADRFLAAPTSQNGTRTLPLAQVPEVAWEMEEGSICGLGQVAALPLVSAMKHFPGDF